MRRVIAWMATCALVLALAAGAEAQKKKSKKVAKKRSSASCLKTTTSDGEAELSWTFTSSCDREVVCSARWVLVCGDDPARDGEKIESVTVAPGERLSITASASECGETWALETPRWTCGQAERASK